MRTFPDWVACLSLLFLAGCTGSGFFSVSPDTNKLSETAQALRKAQPQPVAFPRELNKRVTGPYVVEPGDVLLVAPANLDSPVRLPGDQPVLPDGTINLGTYGRVPVAGKTIDQIEGQIRPLIQSKTRDAGPITVRLVTRQSKVYYVLGEVNAPGAFLLNGHETVLDAIVTAGGLTDRASVANMVLARPSRPGCCRVVLPVCYQDIVQVGDTSTNYQIAPGDRVFVPGQTFWESIFGSSHHKQPPCGCPQNPCPLTPESGPVRVPPGALPQAAIPLGVGPGDRSLGRCPGSKEIARPTSTPAMPGPPTPR